MLAMSLGCHISNCYLDEAAPKIAESVLWQRLPTGSVTNVIGIWPRHTGGNGGGGDMFARTACALVTGLAMVASWSAPASATTTTLNTTERGWYVDTDSFNRHDYHDPTNDNYITGQIGRSDYHDFFTFDLTGVTGTITSATLHL